VSECYHESSIMRRPMSTRGCCAIAKRISKFIFVCILKTFDLVKYCFTHSFILCNKCTWRSATLTSRSTQSERDFYSKVIFRVNVTGRLFVILSLPKSQYFYELQMVPECGTERSSARVFLGHCHVHNCFKCYSSCILAKA
jgi:hypothetical protein